MVLYSARVCSRLPPMPFYQVDNAGGAWTHALHTHADEINDDGNGPTSRTPARRARKQLPRYRVTALPRYRGTPRPRPTLASATALAAGDSQRPPTPARARQEHDRRPCTFPPRAGERSQGSCVNNRNAEHMPGTSTWKWYRTVLFM